MTNKEVFFNTPVAKRARIRQVLIMWTDEDEEEILYPHEDALVIKATAVAKGFDWILIDTGSSVDVLFKSTLEEMGIINLRLEHTNTSLKGFGGGKLVTLGVVELPITIGSSQTEKTMILDFVVVDEKSSYQMILGRPFLRMSKTMLSNHYLALKYRVNGEWGWYEETKKLPEIVTSQQQGKQCRLRRLTLGKKSRMANKSQLRSWKR